jgi:hypothetical protein
LSSSNISVSWDSVSGASGYYVYRASNSDGLYSYFYETSNTFYTDTGLSSNTTYYYKVSAYNGYGESSLSSYDYATTLTSSVIYLSRGIGEENTLSPGDIHHYSFDASPGYTYWIYWADYDYIDSYCDIQVSARDSNGSYFFSGVDVGYRGQSFSVSSSGYITIIVEGHNSSSSGYYRIGYDY